MRLEPQHLPALARGCALYGGGGGGDPAIGELMARAALDEGCTVDLVPLSELPADGLVLPVAMIGAPTVGVEKLPRGDEGQRLRQQVEGLLDREVVAFVCGELGGINGVAPVAWAARAGLPLVDGDLIGRAFPGIQFVVPRLHGIDPDPVVMIDERGNTVTISAITPDWASRYSVSTMVASGALMALTLYPMTVAQARTGIVDGSMSQAIRAGELLMAGVDDPIRNLVDVLGGVTFLEGRVADVDRRTEDGYAKGSAVIDGVGGDAGRMLRLEFQNENLVALIDGVVVGTVPDIITVVDLHSGWPIVTEALRYGQRVAVLGIPCPAVWRSDLGLAVAGPRAFGYDLDYRAMEDSLVQAR